MITHTFPSNPPPPILSNFIYDGFYCFRFDKFINQMSDMILESIELKHDI